MLKLITTSFLLIIPLSCLWSKPNPTNFIYPVTFVSNSIIIIQGSDTVSTVSDNKDIKGILSTIDWDQIPEIGLPKSEIHTIKIISRTNIFASANKLQFSPTLWEFSAPAWTYYYSGSIPYLENLEFLSSDWRKKLSTKTEMEIDKNSLGYYRQKSLPSINIYPAVNTTPQNVVASIHIITAEENQYIAQQQQVLELPPLIETKDIIIVSSDEIPPVISDTNIITLSMSNTNTFVEASKTNTQILPITNVPYGRTSIEKRETLSQ